MAIYILPGFSLSNREWAEAVQANLGGEVVYWSHWESGNNADFSVEGEAQKLKEKIGNEPFTLVAKSIGTLVATFVVADLSMQVDKLIFCGIPVKDLSEPDLENYKILGEIGASKIIVFQNEADNHGSFEEVKQLLNGINTKIVIESMPRQDHEYPYFEDFKKFLG